MNVAALVRLLLAGVLAAMPTMTAAQASANFKSPAFVFNSGVGDMSSANFRTRASVGQAFDAATLSGAAFAVKTGLLAIPLNNGTTGNLPVFNTGVAANGSLLAGGSVDPHYTLIASAEPSLPGPNAIVTTNIAEGYWLPQGPISKWIAPSADQSYPSASPCNAAGTYTYRTVVDLSGFDPATATIQGNWAADNLGTAIRLNGVSIGATQPGYNPFQPFTINSGFVAGVNTLDFVTSDSGCPNGLRVELHGTAAFSAGATAPAFTSAAPVGGTVGNAYNHAFAASGVPTTMTWSITAGTLPPGLTLNAGTGMLSGTPTVAGTFTFTVQAANGVAPNAAQGVRITIGNAAAPGFSPSATTLTFAARTVATTSAAQTLTITNTGSAVLNLAAPMVAGPFALSANNCASVSPSANCAISVTFTPTVAGDATGTLTLATNATGSPHVITLTGTGTAAIATAAFAYITNQSSETVSVIDIATNMIVTTIPVGSSPYGVAVNPAGTRVYVTNGGSNNVMVIDTATNAVIGTVAVGSIPQGIAVTPDGTRVYVANGSSNTVSVINASTNTVVATVTGIFAASGVAIHPAGSFAYVTGGGAIRAIDIDTNTIVATLNTGAASIHGIVVNAAGNRLYVAHSGNDDIYVLDAVTLAEIDIVDLTNGGPTGVALNPSGSRLYVTKYHNGSVTVIDTATLAVLANVAVGTQPIGVNVSPDGSRAYVAVNFPGSVAVIDTGTNMVTANVTVGFGASAFGNFIATPPPAATVPGAPVIGSAVPGNGQATISFTAPAGDGGSPIMSYVVSCSAPAVTATDTSSPVLVTGLVNGTTYMCTVRAVNAIGQGAASAGVSVTPLAAVPGPLAYITNQNSNNVSVIDTASDTVVATIPVGSLPYGVAVNAAGTRVYVTNANSNNVKVIDTASNMVVATISVGTYPNGVAVSPDGTRVYVANSSNSVSVIDTATNAVIATVTAGTTPFGVAVNPAGTRVYVTNNNGNNVSVIDTATNTVVATIPVGFGPHGVAINAVGTRAYVANSSGGISVINTATNTVIATVSTGSSPIGIAVSPDGTRVYVADASGTNGSVRVIDTATNTLITSITVGRLPIGIAFNPAGTRAYVANRNDNNVAVIDTSTNAVLRTVPVGNGPNGFGIFIGTPSAAAPVFSLSFYTLLYLSQTVGTTSAPQTLTIGNSGSADLNFTSTSLTGPFAINANSCGILVPGSTCTISIVFTPTSAGTLNGSLDITTNAANSPHHIQLVGLGAAAAPVIAFTPMSLTYPSQLLNTSLQVPLTVQNTGDGVLTFTQAPTVTGPFEVQLTNTCGNGATIGPGGFVFCQVTFRPTVAGPVTGTLTIYSNAPGSPHVIQLAGTGYATAPVIAFTPMSLTYPSQLLNTSLQVPLTVQNTGDGVLTFTQAPTVTGPFEVQLTNTCGNGATIGPGGFVFCQVTFRPTVAGPVTGTLTIYSNAPGSPHVIQLAGTGYATAPVIAFTPMSLTYPSQLLNTSLQVPLTVQNTGDGVLTFTQAPTVTGPFEVQLTNTCGNGATIGPGGFVFCQVTFRPTVAGPVTGTLTIYSNAPGSPHVIPLAGTGTTTAPAISFNNTALSYPAQQVGTTAENILVVLNTGDGDLTFTQAPSITGPFQVQLTNTCGSGATIAPGSFAFCMVRFTPTQPGAVSGALVLHTNAAGSPHVIPLSGTGVAAGPAALTGVYSRKSHGSSGVFELALDNRQVISGNVTVEPRIAGAGHQIVFRFDGPISNAGALTVVDSTGASITTASPVMAGNEVIVTLTGNLNARRVSISLAGINGSVNASVALGFLVGDVNGSRNVNSQDTNRIKSRTGQFASAGNFLYDITTSGRITAADVILSKALSGSALP